MSSILLPAQTSPSERKATGLGRNRPSDPSVHSERMRPALARGKRLNPRGKKGAPDSEKAIRDECDDLVRQILRGREERFCIVCGVPGENTDLHPGHYITRKVLALRWDLRNVWPQCDFDNQAHNTNPSWYRSMLIMEIGEAEVKELERIGKENPHLFYADFLAIRDGLRVEARKVRV